MSRVFALSVVSFKVRKEIKEKMEKYRDRVNWPEELRKFVEEKIRQLEAEENMQRIIEELEKIPVQTPSGFSKDSVREDRDSG
nr:CopG family transcriptional regulator [Pyrodictium delaneyi]